MEDTRENYTLKGVNHSPDKRKPKAYIIKLNKSKGFFFSSLKKVQRQQTWCFGNGPNSFLVNRNYSYKQNIPNEKADLKGKKHPRVRQLPAGYTDNMPPTVHSSPCFIGKSEVQHKKRYRVPTLGSINLRRGTSHEITALSSPTSDVTSMALLNGNSRLPVCILSKWTMGGQVHRQWREPLGREVHLHCDAIPVLRRLEDAENGLSS